MVYYNTTRSTASQYIGVSIFAFAWRYENMLIASDSPIEIDIERFRDRLESWAIEGRPVLRLDTNADPVSHSLSLKHWRGEPIWERREQISARTDAAPIIHDDTMATESWVFETFL